MKTAARGFTLIEMMISMALFGLIAAGAMALVMAGARSQAHSARVDVAQSSLRAGIDFISRDVMMLSAGASTGQITLPGNALVSAVDFTNNNNTNVNGTTGTDWLDMYLVDGTIAGEIVGNVAGGVTALSVVYEQSTGLFPSPPPANSYVQVCDLRTATVVALTGVTNTGTTSAALTVAALPTSIAFTGNTAFVLPSRHVKYQISKNVFTVAAGAQANTSMLTLDVNGAGAQPLAEGVEDMQIAYGFDTNADGVVTESVVPTADSDEWLYNVSGDTILAGMVIANLRVIRITLVAKSTSSDTGAQYNSLPIYEDHVAITGDGFIRRVLRTEITVRNFNL